MSNAPLAPLLLSYGLILKALCDTLHHLRQITAAVTDPEGVQETF